MANWVNGLTRYRRDSLGSSPSMRTEYYLSPLYSLLSVRNILSTRAVCAVAAGKSALPTISDLSWLAVGQWIVFSGSSKDLFSTATRPAVPPYVVCNRAPHTKIIQSKCEA